MSRFSGIWVPLVTPFQQDQSIDFPALQALAHHVAQAGVTGLVVCGSTGEAAALDDAEQLAVLDAVLEAAPDCRVVMGLSGNHLPGLLAKLEEIQARRIAGLLVPPPCYIRPSQQGIVDYFTRLADAARAPLILYNIPYRTGVNMALESIRILARHEHIVAIKDCGGDAHLTMQLISDGQLDVLAGEDHQIFTTLCLGGSGAIAASAHIRPDLFVHLARLIQMAQLAEARQLFNRLLPLIRLLFAEPNPAPVKALLCQHGYVSNALRFPLQAASLGLQAELGTAWQQIETLPLMPAAPATRLFDAARCARADQA